MPGRRGEVRRALSFGAILLCYAWFVHFWPTFHAANESIRFYFVSAVVDHGTVQVDQVMERYKVGNVDRAEFGGHAYMDKAPGLSFAVMPVYWALTSAGMSTDRSEVWRLWYWLLLIGVSLPCVFGIWCTWDVVRDWTGDERAAATAAIVLGMATPYAVYATLFFGHGPAAALAVMSFWALRRRWLVLAGLLAGGMVLVDTATAFMAVILGVYAGLRHRSLDDMIRFGMGGIPGVAGQLAYNTWCFGEPLTFAYSYKASADLAAIHEQGVYGFIIPGWEPLWGLTFGGHRGLLYHAPVLLLAAAAIKKGGSRDGWLLAAASGLYFLWIACFVDWPAGAAYAPRHLVPITPFLAIGVGLAVARYPRLVWAAAPLALASAVVAWSAIATFPYAPLALDVPFTQQAWAMVSEGELAGTLWGLPAWGVLVPAGVAVGVWRPRPQVVLASLAGVGLVVGMVWLGPAGGTEIVESRISVECLTDYVAEAKGRCEGGGGEFNELRCRCSFE
ncbi:MAG: hypothetical protein ACI9WU_001934 [Myxococcota bacterium]|jgi:hypothetical protein